MPRWPSESHTWHIGRMAVQETPWLLHTEFLYIHCPPTDPIIKKITSNAQIKTIEDLKTLELSWIFAERHGQEVLDLLQRLDQQEHEEKGKKALEKREAKKKKTAARQETSKRLKTRMAIPQQPLISPIYRPALQTLTATIINTPQVNYDVNKLLLKIHLTLTSCPPSPIFIRQIYRYIHLLHTCSRFLIQPFSHYHTIICLCHHSDDVKCIKCALNFI